jgi:LPS sulfotransferase NodH
MLTLERLAHTGKRFYCICFSIRSGSSLLCEDLAQWGMGEPTEYFQFPNPNLTDRDLRDYLVALAEGARDECFGFKISWDQAWELALRLRREGDQSVTFDLRSVFPDLSYVHLVRRDKIGQAVSAWRAASSGVWHWPVGEDVKPGHPPYDFESIKPPLQQGLAEDWLWQRHFQRVGIRPLTITYEDYLEDRAEHLHRVVEHVGVAAAPVPLQERLHVMRDSWTQRICDTFEADLYTVADPLAVRSVPRASPGPTKPGLTRESADRGPALLRALPPLVAAMAVVLGVAVTAETAVPQVALAPLLILAPLLASLLVAPKGIALVGGLAALAMIPLGLHDHIGRSAAEIWIIAGILAATLAGIWISTRRARLLGPSAVLGPPSKRDAASIEPWNQA